MSFFVLTNEKPEFMAQFVHSSRTGAFVANNRFIYRNDAIMMNMKVYIPEVLSFDSFLQHFTWSC